MVEELNNQIRDFREASSLTQAQLAELMGVSRKTVNTVENGVFAPSVIVALKFAHALETSVEQLFELKSAHDR
ncbi:helix-turn-helix transcriptional regulator [Qipengyuania marisflavi]|uniref:Helix-turn-helix transcriptional regulator n=1 Tax=Qipengyuania marisflavi TaxID=2486356 RepID=A0A5S3P652_9SPHN|nr:helix-turn-helix transcriptional regulator [Qipengyuania marisflavi]TMM48703.1 helix-turn-helix transcriptional regulator [Qipengyuania marisflavi]